MKVDIHHHESKKTIGLSITLPAVALA